MLSPHVGAHSPDAGSSHGRMIVPHLVTGLEASAGLNPRFLFPEEPESLPFVARPTTDEFWLQSPLTLPDPLLKGEATVWCHSCCWGIWDPRVTTPRNRDHRSPGHNHMSHRLGGRQAQVLPCMSPNPPTIPTATHLSPVYFLLWIQPPS